VLFFLVRAYQLTMAGFLMVLLSNTFVHDRALARAAGSAIACIPHNQRMSSAVVSLLRFGFYFSKGTNSLPLIASVIRLSARRQLHMNLPYGLLATAPSSTLQYKEVLHPTLLLRM